MSRTLLNVLYIIFFFQAEDGIRDKLVTGVQTCALPISRALDGAEQCAAAAEPGTRAGSAGYLLAEVQAGPARRAQGHRGPAALPHAFAGGVPGLGGPRCRRAVLQLLRSGGGVQEPRRPPVSRSLP